MMRVGLTGSIASGKSEVAKLFRAAGIPVFDADAAVHEIYTDAARAALVGVAFPSALVDGRIDRTLLSAHLLKSPADFPRLEAIIHPLVRQERQDFMARHAAKDFVVLDIPLLFETGEDRQMDCVVVVTTAGRTQRQRALARPGMTEEKLDRILARQLPAVEKAARADFVIENNASLADLQNAVERLIPQLKARARKSP